MCRLNGSLSKEFLLPISMPCSSAMQTYYTKSGPQRSINGHFRRRRLGDCAEVFFTLHPIFTFFMSSVIVLLCSKWTWPIFVTVFVLFVVQCSLLLVFYIIFTASCYYSCHSLLCEWKDITSTCLQLLHTR
jgi:hypothetical protein